MPFLKVTLSSSARETAASILRPGASAMVAIWECFFPSLFFLFFLFFVCCQKRKKKNIRVAIRVSFGGRREVLCLGSVVETRIDVPIRLDRSFEVV
jgi:hypothetical protein